MIALSGQVIMTVSA